MINEVGGLGWTSCAGVPWKQHSCRVLLERVTMPSNSSKGAAASQFARKKKRNVEEKWKKKSKKQPSKIKAGVFYAKWQKSKEAVKVTSTKQKQKHSIRHLMKWRTITHVWQTTNDHPKAESHATRSRPPPWCGQTQPTRMHQKDAGGGQEEGAGAQRKSGSTWEAAQRY